MVAKSSCPSGARPLSLQDWRQPKRARRLRCQQKTKESWPLFPRFSVHPNDSDRIDRGLASVESNSEMDGEWK